MKKLLMTLGLIITLTVGGLLIWHFTQPTLVADAATRKAFTVTTSDIVSTVRGSNRLAADTETNLAFQSGGVVETVFVSEGDFVHAGDPIAQLDTTDAMLQLAQAEANLAKVQAGARPEEISAAQAQLAAAQANYANLMTGSSEADLRGAQAALNSAWANYQAVQEGPNQEELTVAAATFRDAEVTLQHAQTEYDKIAYVDNIGETPQAAQLQRATITYEAARANYTLVSNGAADEQISMAQAQVEQAQAALDKLHDGANAHELAAAQAQIDQAAAQLALLQNGPRSQDVTLAKLQVAQAEHQLGKMTLAAPHDGVVAGVMVNPGEMSAGYAATLANLETLHIALLVDEIDLPTVQPGQPAIVALDAYPDQPMTGVVRAIAPTPVSSAGGVASYKVTIDLPQPIPEAQVGMTANVDIETKRREAVIAIPAALVQLELETGQTYVDVLTTNGQVRRVDVTLGLRSGKQVEIISGLQAGDQVLDPVAQVDQGNSDEHEGNLLEQMNQARSSIPDIQ